MSLISLTLSLPLSRPLGFAHLCRGFPARSIHSIQATGTRATASTIGALTGVSFRAQSINWIDPAGAPGWQPASYERNGDQENRRAKHG